MKRVSTDPRDKAKSDDSLVKTLSPRSETPRHKLRSDGTVSVHIR